MRPLVNKNSDNSWDFGECTKHEDVKDQSTFEVKRLINCRFHLYTRNSDH